MSFQLHLQIAISIIESFVSVNDRKGVFDQAQMMELLAMI